MLRARKPRGAEEIKTKKMSKLIYEALHEVINLESVPVVADNFHLNMCAKFFSVDTRLSARCRLSIEALN